MEINEIKKRRSDLIDDILDMIFTFEEDTDTVVEDIDLTTDRRMNRDGEYVVTHSLSAKVVVE